MMQWALKRQDARHERPSPLATRAWAAFRAPTPAGLGAIAAARLGELRFPGEAFDRLSQEHPATRDGLSLTERRVLAAVADGAPDAGTAVARARSRTVYPRAEPCRTP